MIKQTIAEELRAKKSRDNRELLDRAADYIEALERERDALDAENQQLKASRRLMFEELIKIHKKADELGDALRQYGAFLAW